MPEKLESIDAAAFWGCTGLTEIVIPESVRTIGRDGYSSGSVGAFSHCTGLTNVVLSDGVTTLGDSTFYGCQGLTEIVLPKTVAEIGKGVFSDCLNLSRIDVDGDNQAYSSVDGILFDKSQSTMICCPLAKEGNYVIPSTVTVINAFAFSGCTNMTSVVIPASVSRIETHPFMGCTRLANIWVDEGNQYFTAEDGVLFNKSKTEVISCSAYTAGAYAIPVGVERIGSYAFAKCSNLEEVLIPESVTSMGERAFMECAGLKKVIIEPGITEISEFAFKDCIGLEEIELPDGLESIGNSAFLRCSSLKQITFPETLTRIEGIAFSGCSSLLHLTIPETVTYVGSYVFENCTSLLTIKFPRNPESFIGSCSFIGCDNVKVVVIQASTGRDGGYFDEKELEEWYMPYLSGKYPEITNVKPAAKRVFVPIGMKANLVASIQTVFPTYTGENVFELDFDAQSFAINAAEGYGTYYTDRPFVMPEGVEGGVVTPGDAEGVMRVDYRYAAGDVVPAGVGLVLKGEPGTYAYESKYFYEAPAAPTENLLSGTVQQTVLPDDGGVAYYMLSYDREGADLGFYWGAEDGGPFTNGAHRAYLALPRGEAALAKAFVLDGDHLATGIGGVTSPTAGVPAAVYTLSGTKVTTPVDQLPRGLYIINGKKVFVPGK